jgi:hypothetical protein
MTDNFRSLIFQLNDDELSNYIFELGRQKDIDTIKHRISSNHDSSLEILLCSFLFEKTQGGIGYWSQIVERIRNNNQK